MKDYVILFVKGVAMGTANIIPGVSGGTIALITGIFERLIEAMKSLNGKALKLLLQGKWKDFAAKTDFLFLLIVFAGVGAAILSLARLFEILFRDYPVYIWSYFFGLVFASVYFVGKTIEHWSVSVWISFFTGTIFALGITFLSPASQNDNFFYLIICGVFAVCSMILPGLSGSFVLILLGNYQLVAIDAINNLDFGILFPILIGAVGGLIAFSHFLSWLLKSYKAQTISLLTGFILGSLGVIWPWKTPIYMTNELGENLLKNGKPIIERYRQVLPETLDNGVVLAIALMITGVISIWIIETMAKSKTKQTTDK